VHFGNCLDFNCALPLILKEIQVLQLTLTFLKAKNLRMLV